MSVGGKAVWEKHRVHLIQSQKAAHKRRKQLCIDNETQYFNDSTRKSFALAKLKKSNNHWGIYLIDVLNIDYKPYKIKSKRLLTHEYKKPDNYYTQIDELYDTITDIDKELVGKSEMIHLIERSRLASGLTIYK